MKKTLVVTFNHGLCNRLRVLLCAIAYSEVTNRKLLIHWRKEENFGAALSDLWQHPYQEIGNVRRKLYENLFGRHTKPDTIQIGLDRPVVCLNTVYPFCRSQYPEPLGSYLTRLKLIEPLEQQVEAFASRWFDNNVVVGVSIRYHGAHPQTAEASPPEWFIRRINEIHAQFPHVRFFLSADCEEVSQIIRAATPATICQIPRTYRSDRPEGLQEALCELYLLTKTNYVLGSYYSSFSNMVSSLRGNLAYEHSQAVPEADVMFKALATPIRSLQSLRQN